MNVPASSSPFRSDVLKGLVVLVTGGGTGINFGIACQMAAHGANLSLMGRRKEVVEKSAQQLIDNFKCKTIAFQGDVRNYSDCEKVVTETVASLGRLDVLVNGAAGNFLCPAEKLSSNGFKTVIDIDLMGSFNMNRASFSFLQNSKSALIIHISATLGYTATPFQVHAAAAKVAVDSMTRTLALEWGRYGIRVCGIAPGPIENTEGFSRLVVGIEPKQLSSRIPIGRVGTVDDIGYCAVYLASPVASFITGHTVVVDGASWLGKPIPNEATIPDTRNKKSKL